MQHVLCAHIPRWPIDRLCRRRTELRHKALVLIESIGNRQMVIHVSADAPRTIHPGLTLTEAGARCADLLSLPTETVEDLRGLEALGRWLMRFSPGVSLYPPNSLFLDATGLERLFGSLHNLRNRVDDALVRLRIKGRVAIAPTPGAAWALAAYGKSPAVVQPDELPDLLRRLPVQALRLDAPTVNLLQTLGVHTIHALLKLPRESLSARFGDAVTRRIDQALGHLIEPLNFLQHRTPICATLEFDGAVESLEVLHLVVRQLVAEVVGHLIRQGLGAREMRLAFRPPYTPVIEKTVSFARPSRNESVIFNLLRCVLETLKTREGFVAASLFVSTADRLGDSQASLVDAQEERQAAELDHLVERLQARRVLEWAKLVESHLPERAFMCRDGAVPPTASETRASFAVEGKHDKEYLRQYGKAIHPKPFTAAREDNLHEGASCPLSLVFRQFPQDWGEGHFLSFSKSDFFQVSRSPLTLTLSPEYEGEGTDEITRDCPEGNGAALPTSQDIHFDSPAIYRPLCLLTAPKSIRVIVTPFESRQGHPISFTHEGEVHHLVHVLGPERITGEWWTGHWKTRDYFDALDSAGNRYWLFRALQTGRWFLHGKFE